jgi:beta-galactosidase/beta-glucuronidase
VAAPTGAGAQAVKLSGTVPKVQPWSAEQPTRYQLRLVLEDGQGRPLAATSTLLGFRSRVDGVGRTHAEQQRIQKGKESRGGI